MVEEKAEAATGVTGPASADAAIGQSGEALHRAADVASVAPGRAQESTAELSGAAAPFEPTGESDNQFNRDGEAAAGIGARADAGSGPGQVIVVPFGNHGSEHEAGKRRDRPSKRRFAALAILLALATGAGAFGGAFATATLFHGPETAGSSSSLDASITRIEADILALKASLEFGSKLGQSQFNKTSERLEKIEKAQAEPAAKLARLSESVDRLRAVPLPLPAPPSVPSASAREVTGSIASASPQSASRGETARNETARNEAAKGDAKTEAGKLPTLEGWVLRDVVHGGALIDGRRGMYEVYAGDVIPGLGRIDAIRRQDGHWVVVTSKGLIIAR